MNVEAYIKSILDEKTQTGCELKNLQWWKLAHCKNENEKFMCVSVCVSVCVRETEREIEREICFFLYLPL